MFLHFSLQHFACPALITLRKHVDKNRLHESTFSNCQQKQISHCISLQSKFSSGFFRFIEDSNPNTQTSRGRKSVGSNGSQVCANLIGGFLRNTCRGKRCKFSVGFLLALCLHWGPSWSGCCSLPLQFFTPSLSTEKVRRMLSI